MSMYSSTIQLDPGFLTKTAQIQLLYGVWVNMAHFGIGLAFGFASVQIPQLSKSDSDIQITRVDASWIASVLPLFCPIGCLISGFVMDRSGRKVMLIFCQVPMFVGWIYTSLARTPKHLIIGRAITGIGCGMAMGPPRVFCTEISLPNMRGVLGALSNMAVSIGITVQAVLGKFFHWQVLCYFCCFTTFVNFATFMYLPETPYFIIQTKTVAEAEVNLAKFRASDYNVSKELDQLLDFKEDNDIRKLSVSENMKALFTIASCKPFWLMIIYILIAQASGVTAITFWAVELLTAANSSINPLTGNIMFTLTRVVVGILASLLIYRVGRRPLGLTSAVGVSLVCLSLGAFLYVFTNPSIIPVICFMLYMAFATLGYYPLPFLMAYELFPLQVRGILGGVTVAVTSLMIFGSTKMEPFIMDYLGVANTFLLFGSTSLVGSIFLYYFMPETKDLTLQEIEEYYNDIRPTLTSERRLLTLSQMTMKVGSSTSKLGMEKIKDVDSRTSMLAKLEAQKRLAEVPRKEQPLDKEEESNRTEPESITKKTSTVDIQDKKEIEDTDDQNTLSLSKQTSENKRIRFTLDEANDNEETRKKDEKSKDPKKSIKDDEDGTRDKNQQHEENEIEETRKKDKESSKGNEDVTRDKDQHDEENKNEEIRKKDKESKEPKESSKGNEDATRDKDQPSTSKRDT